MYATELENQTVQFKDIYSNYRRCRFLARLDEFQEELLYYPRRRRWRWRRRRGVSKMLKFLR